MREAVGYLAAKAAFTADGTLEVFIPVELPESSGWVRNFSQELRAMASEKARNNFFINGAFIDFEDLVTLIGKHQTSRCNRRKENILMMAKTGRFQNAKLVVL
jgi:hypothetical protein